MIRDLVPSPGCLADLNVISARSSQRHQWGSTAMTCEFDEKSLRLWSRTFHSVNGPVAIVGAIPWWQGNAQVWALFSDEALTYPIALTKLTRLMIERYKVAMCLRRMTMTVDAKEDTALRWATRGLYFNIEGLMVGYGTRGEDHYLLARTWI